MMRGSLSTLVEAASARRRAGYSAGTGFFASQPPFADLKKLAPGEIVVSKLALSRPVTCQRVAAARGET